MRSLVLLAAVIAGGTLFSACSLERKTAGGITVKLDDSASRLAEHMLFSLLAVPAPQNRIQYGPDASCFGVNVTGGTITPGTACGLSAGITTAMIPGPGASFQISAPISAGTTFEAYATNPAPGCPGSLLGSGAHTLFKVGTVPAPDSFGATVVIPVVFDRNAATTCDNSLPIAYFDTLAYPPAVANLATTSAWTAATGLNDLSLGGGSVIGTPATDEGDLPTGVSLDRTRASYRLSLSFSAISAAAGGAQVRIGLADSAVSGTAHVIACEIDLGATLANFKVKAGTGSNGFVPPGTCGAGCAPVLPVGPFAGPVGDDTLICDIVRNGSGWDVTVSVVDASGVPLTAPFTMTGATDQCATAGCVLPYLQVNNLVGGAGLTATYRNFLVQQSSN